MGVAGGVIWKQSRRALLIPRGNTPHRCCTNNIQAMAGVSCLWGLGRSGRGWRAWEAWHQGRVAAQGCVAACRCPHGWFGDGGRAASRGPGAQAVHKREPQISATGAIDGRQTHVRAHSPCGRQKD